MFKLHSIRDHEFKWVEPVPGSDYLDEYLPLVSEFKNFGNVKLLRNAKTEYIEYDFVVASLIKQITPPTPGTDP